MEGPCYQQFCHETVKTNLSEPIQLCLNDQRPGFIEEEAEVSGDEGSSDEDDVDGEDYEMSFIDNHSETQGAGEILLVFFPFFVFFFNELMQWLPSLKVVGKVDCESLSPQRKL